MLILNGKKYGKSKKEIIETLFNPTGSANGYYRQTKSGIKIYNLQKELLAFIKISTENDKYPHDPFIVSAYTTDSGRIRCMFGLEDSYAKFLGFAGMSIADERQAVKHAVDSMT